MLNVADPNESNASAVELRMETAVVETESSEDVAPVTFSSPLEPTVIDCNGLPLDVNTNDDELNDPPISTYPSPLSMFAVAKNCAFETSDRN